MGKLFVMRIWKAGRTALTIRRQRSQEWRGEQSVARGSVSPVRQSLEQMVPWSLLALQSVHPREQKPALQMWEVHVAQVSGVFTLARINGWF